MHLVLPALNLSNLNAGILTMMQHVEGISLRNFYSLIYCETPPSCLKVISRELGVEPVSMVLEPVSMV